VFAAASIIPVALWLLQPPPERELRMSGWQGITIAQAVVLASTAVIPAALVGGFLAGLLVRRHPAIAAFVAMTLSWWIGIAMLPLAAGVLGIRYTAGFFCVDGCTAFLDYQSPQTGFLAFLISVPVSIAALPYALALPVVLGSVAFLMRRRMITILFAVSVHSALSTWSILFDGLLPYVCLVVGVILWAMWLAEPAARAEESAAIDGEAVAPVG
jgi:hypothetical protein